jgi:hypothetical protein
MPTVTIHRPSSWVYGARQFKVLVDGIRVGAVASGSTWEQEVRPGLHSVQVTIDFLKSQLLECRLGDGDRAEFECGCEYTMTDLMIPILAIIRFFQGRRFVYLEQLARSGRFSGAKTSLRGMTTAQ